MPSPKINTPILKRENGKVWIDGVQGFKPCDYVSSVHGSQVRILQALGESLTYDDLICYSAFAFRVEFHEGNCPSAGHPFVGYPCVENGIRALPCKFKVFELPKGDKPMANKAAFEAEACAAIKASIDRGIPVHYGSEEDGLIIGYGDEGRRWWCVHPYHKNGSEAFWYDEIKSLDDGFAGGKGKWPWGIAVYTEPKGKDERVSNRKLTIAALKQAVDMWNTEKRGAYFVGDAAYAFWLKWLRDVEAGTVKDPKAGMQGNAWCFEVLIHSRGIAGQWLKRAADNFTGEASKQLHVAADHYTQIAEVCMKDIKNPWDLAPYPNHFGTWTSQMRKQEIDRLEAAREHDRAAVAAITQALTNEGISVTSPVETRTLTDDDKARLLQWQNMFGWNIAQCIEGMEKNPEVYKLLVMEKSLEPMGKETKLIRKAMAGLEPAEYSYWNDVEMVVRAIGEGKLPDGTNSQADQLKAQRMLPSPDWPERERDIVRCVQAMRSWLNGIALADARKAADTQPAVFDRVYELLGQPQNNEEEKHLVTLVVMKLEGQSIKEQLTALRKSPTLTPFADRIEQLDEQMALVGQVWSFDYNLMLLLGDIGRGQVSGEWHQPGGPLGWGEGRPEDASKVAGAIPALQAWLDKKPSGHPFAKGLGDLNAYKEKPWLVRCLLVYLQDHYPKYYRWTEPTNQPSANKPGVASGTIAQNITLTAEKTTIPSATLPASAMLKEIPTGKGNSNSYARGLAILLTAVGTPVDYDRVMAASGQAFITQSQLGEPLFDGAVDVGWWPLDSWGIDMRLEFLSCVFGREIRRVNGDPNVYNTNPGLNYRQRFDQEVKAAITAGKPVLAQIEPWFVVAGYDEKDPPLLGHCAFQEKKETTRIPEYPWALVLAGNKIEPMNQKIADLETLRYAVALIRDNAADPTGIVPGCPIRQVHPAGRAQFSGRQSFALWAKALRDLDHLGQARWHANMCFNLGINRRSAVTYLHETGKRFPAKTADHLTAGAALYEKVLAELGTADTSEPAMKSRDGREKLAQLVERIAVLEGQVAEQLEQALILEGIKAPALKTFQEETLSPSANAKHPVRGIPFRPWQNMFITQVACLKPCLEHLGIKISIPWLYGGTGRAFMMNIHETLCPSGWYVADSDQDVYRLAKNLGFTVEHLAGTGIEMRQPGFAEKQKEVWEKTRRALDAGLPCYTFDVGVCDYQPVYGYDDVGYYYSLGDAKNGAGPYPWQDLGRKGELHMLYMDIVHPSPAAADRQTLKETLDFAVKFANKKTDPKNPYAPGLAAYDRWIAALESGKAQGFGATYNAACYAEARSNAVDFLKEAKSKMPAELALRFTKAIEAYQITADNLKQLSDLFPFPHTSDQDVKKPETIKQAVQRLRAAKEAEQKGLRALADLVKELNSSK